MVCIKGMGFSVWQVKRQETKLGMKEGEWQESALYFLRQIAFREYARYLSFHFPFTHERSLLEHLRAAPWKFDQRLFKASSPLAAKKPSPDASPHNHAVDPTLCYYDSFVEQQGVN